MYADVKGGFVLKYIIIFTILMIAVVQDVHCSKVSNNLIFLGYSISFIYQCFMKANMLFWFQGVFIPIGSLFLLFYLKMFGAGDIKLLSVIGGFCGWKISMYILLLALFYGAVWSCYKIMHYKNGKDRILYFMKYLAILMLIKKRIPYRESGSSDKSYTISFSVLILIAFISWGIFKLVEVF